MKSRKIVSILILVFVLFLIIGGINDFFAAAKIHIQVTAEPNKIPADGQTKALLKLHVTNKDGTPRSGDRIYCFADFGNLKASRVLTDNNGDAEFEYFPIRATDVMKAKNDSIKFYDESISKIIQLPPKTQFELTITTPTKSDDKGMTSDDLFK